MSVRSRSASATVGGSRTSKWTWSATRADFERKTTFCLKDASEIGAKFRPKTRLDRLGAGFCSKDQVVVEAGVGVRHDLALEVEFGSVAPFRGFAAFRNEPNPAFARWAKFWRPFSGLRNTAAYGSETSACRTEIQHLRDLRAESRLRFSPDGRSAPHSVYQRKPQLPLFLACWKTARGSASLRGLNSRL